MSWRTARLWRLSYEAPTYMTFNGTGKVVRTGESIMD